MVERAPAEPLSEGASDRLSAEEVLPRQFGKYTLMRRLAAGGMAELFLALHRSVAGFEKLVVIKRILPSMNSDKGFIEMLLHEARIAATLSHPNIVQIFDVGQIEGKYFIAMEHIHGEDIRSILRAMKRCNVAEFPLEHTLSLVVGMCAGLAYAHEKRDFEGALLNIVHRDVSPQNILVTFTGDVKIVDFGIAKSEAQLGEETRDGQLKGKVPYMSPEQASGEPVDWRTDIFAVGIILFELTTGKRLFKGASEYETLRLICDRDYPLPSQVRAGYLPALERIVMKALAKKREDRYQSAREMQSDLEKVIREERIPASQVGLTHWMHSLFEEKLNQQKEVLQDIKQLADELAAQQPHAEGTLTRMASGSRVIGPRDRRSATSRALFLAALTAVGAAVGATAIYATRSPGREARPQPPQRSVIGAPTEIAPTPAPAEEAKGWIDISTKPEGCAIWINGDLRRETTPARIENLPRDRELGVKLTKEGLEPYSETVTLSASTPSRTISAELKAGTATVVLKIEPPPQVWLDGKPWKGDASRLDDISAGEEHKLVMAATGYASKTVTFVAQPGETKIIEEKLRKLDGAKGGEPAPASGTNAKVRVRAQGGFCSVAVNGVQVGPTPVETAVNAGTVRITCKPESGPAIAQSVKVSPGETARISFQLN